MKLPTGSTASKHAPALYPALLKGATMCPTPSCTGMASTNANASKAAYLRCTLQAAIQILGLMHWHQARGSRHALTTM